MKKLFTLSILALCALYPAFAKAAVMDSPAQVQISPGGARLSVEAILPLVKEEGLDSISLLIPFEAKDMVFNVPGYVLIDWRTETQRFDESAASGGISGKRAAMLKEKADADSEIRALKARLALWSLPAANPLPSDEMDRRDAKLVKIIPELEKELITLKKRSDDLKSDIEALPKTAEQVKKITINMQPKTGSVEDTAVVRYSYTLDNCGWRPTYRFDAHPDADNVGVSLIAEIWQYSGIDWQKSHITLVSQGGGQVAPGRIRPWPIRIHEADPHAPAMMMAAPAPKMELKENSLAARPRQAAPVQSEGTAFSYWDLGAINIIEGSTKLNLNEEVWDAPLEWLARPSISNVSWLTLKHNLDSKKYWPVGQAVFSIDGHAVGNGSFAAKNGEVELFFGPDPRVSLVMERKSRLADKTGIIERRKTLDWVWEIGINNTRSKDVRIRVEEPAPEADDKSVSINYVGSPAPKEGKDHVLYWDVTVPAGGKATISHGVSISVPAEADVKPGR